jgi:hypothetical protein
LATPTLDLERRTSNPAPDTNPTRDNYPVTINQLLHAPRVAPQTMPPTWNETNDPYDAEGEDEPQNARACRRRTEDPKTNRHRRLLKTGTAKPTLLATTETMDTSDDCPGPAAEPQSPRQTFVAELEAMDIDEGCPAHTSETAAPPNRSAAQTPIPNPRPTEATRPPNPSDWKTMSKVQKKHWYKQGGKWR